LTAAHAIYTNRAVDCEAIHAPAIASHYAHQSARLHGSLSNVTAVRLGLDVVEAVAKQASVIVMHTVSKNTGRNKLTAGK